MSMNAVAVRNESAAAVGHRPATVQRCAVAALALLAHAGIGWLITREHPASVTAGDPEGSLLMISLPADPAATPASLATITLPPAPRWSIDPPSPGILGEELPTPAVPTGRTTPPHPQITPDTHPFAQAARLPLASGVTVVLRLEVLKTGAVGRVEVEVSGGSSRIDRAAIAYARAVKWVSGRVEDRPETLWIRWGVRLDG